MEAEIRSLSRGAAVSVEALQWAINLEGEITAPEKVALVVLANYANKVGENCYPSLDLIARKTRLGRSTVPKILERLERAGIISRDRSPGGPRQATHYTLNMSNCLPQRQSQEANCLSQSANCLSQSVQLSPTETLSCIEPIRTNTCPKSSPSTVPHESIIDAYHEALPELPKILKLRWKGSQAEKDLATRWREDKRHQDPGFWTWFFESVRTNPFWLGDNGRGWRADLRWLVKRANFDKVVERGASANQTRRVAQ